MAAIMVTAGLFMAATASAQKLLEPLRWIGRNWSAYDPEYAVPSFYNWAVQAQNTTSQEWLNMSTPDGLDLRTRSQMSNRMGLYLGWRFLFYGATIDLNNVGHRSKNKDEFVLSINSNLVNVDLIRRRTGGDFVITRMNQETVYGNVIDMTDGSGKLDLGDCMRNSITGFNINYFINHRRYSNPAAFSNGAIQLRSVGSPIVGLGYTHQRFDTNLSDLFFDYGSQLFFDENQNPLFSEEEVDRVDKLRKSDPSAYHVAMEQMLEKAWPYMMGDDDLSLVASGFLLNRIPTSTRIDNWHLQLGYAYNLVFSRRLLLGLSLIASPGILHMQSDNRGSLSYEMGDAVSRIAHKYEGIDVSANSLRYDYHRTQANLNAYGRASLTFNFNRWRAGFNASFSGLFSNGEVKIHNIFGNVSTYVGYCFGRKKEFRFNGANRQLYIEAALTNSQKDEMRNTKPAGNLSSATAYADSHGHTKRYHADNYDIDIYGCDLVAGPDGRYGWIEIEDGYVTPGQDTEGRLAPGKVLEIDDKGQFICHAGHSASITAGHWWKSQLRLDQIPNHWYPEMLHYALRGHLTLFVRGRIFGTRKPVRLDIDDFCLNHGRESQSFVQMGIRSFRSRSTYSIEGRVTVNGRLCRVYIEQRKRGRLTNMYISRVYDSNANWMSELDGNRPVSSISMPGTHDSGTASLAESPIFTAGHTQNFSVPDQLYDGIRAFDIRLKRNLHYGHTMTCRERFDSTLVAWDRFLAENPSECIVALIGSDEGGKWDNTLIENFRKLVERYRHRFVQHFSASTPLDSVRGKILMIRRQEECPYGKLLKFTDNATFDYDCFRVEDVYKEHKTWKKIKVVERNIRDAYENEDPNRWYITFNSIAWSPRRQSPYGYAWGGKANVRRPMNKNLREFIELKDYTDFGIVFLDFYNDHGDNPQVVETIIRTNFHRDE